MLCVCVSKDIHAYTQTLCLPVIARYRWMNISTEQKNVLSNGHDPTTNDRAHVHRAQFTDDFLTGV